MKKSIAAIAILGSAAMAVSASASLLIYEPFAPSATDGTGYAVGDPITGQVNTTSAASETWQLVGPAAALHVVASGSLTAPSPLPASIGNMADLKKSGTSSSYDRLSIPNAFNTDLTPKYGANSSLYYSLLLDVPSITGLTIAHSNANANNDGLIAFNNTQGSSGTAPNTWTGELAIRLGSTAGTYNLGIRASTTTANTTYWTDDLNPGDTHFIVVGTQLGAVPATAADDLHSIWLDPNPATFGAAVAPTADGSSNGGGGNSIQSIIIGAGISTAGSAPNDTYMDEIRVGETWADVTSVPEPTTLGLAALGALGLLRRRRLMA